LQKRRKRGLASWIVRDEPKKYADAAYSVDLLRARHERPRGRRAAAPPTSVMNSRRLTGWPLKQRVLPYHAAGCIVHHGKFWLPMSALCHKRTAAIRSPRRRWRVT